MANFFREMDKCVNEFSAVIDEITSIGKKIDADFAWKVYKFINHYKTGEYGEVTLQEALDKHWEEFFHKELIKESHND